MHSHAHCNANFAHLCAGPKLALLWSTAVAILKLDQMRSGAHVLCKGAGLVHFMPIPSHFCSISQTVHITYLEIGFVNPQLVTGFCKPSMPIWLNPGCYLAQHNTLFHLGSVGVCTALEELVHAHSRSIAMPTWAIPQHQSACYAGLVYRPPCGLSPGKHAMGGTVTK